MSFLDVVRGALPVVSLRDRTDADIAFLSGLYASTREEELRQVDWSDEQKHAFLHDQFTRQHAHYLQHYPRAEWLILEREAAPVGRLYVETTGVEIRLMDVALLPAFRGGGIGTALMHALLAHADALGLPVTLHVEPFNPALRLYTRLGFVALEERGLYLFMRRAAPAEDDLSGREQRGA